MPNTIKVNKDNLESAIIQFESALPSIENVATTLEGVSFDSKKLRPSVKKQMNELSTALAEKVRTIATNTESFYQDLVKINTIVEEINKGVYNDKNITLAENNNSVWTSAQQDDVWELLNIFKRADLMSGTSIFSSVTITSAGTFYPVFANRGNNSQTWNSREEWATSIIDKYKNQGYSEEEAKEMAEYDMAYTEYVATGATVFGKNKLSLSELYSRKHEIVDSKEEEKIPDNPGGDPDDTTGGSTGGSNGGGNLGGQTPDNPSNPQITTTSAIKARIETPTPSPTEQQKVEEVLSSDTPSSDNVETPSIDENNNQISDDSNNNANVDIPSTGNNSNSNNNNITTNPGTTTPVNNGNTNTTNNSVNYSPSGNTYYGSRNDSGSSYNSGNYGSNEPASISNPVPDAENISTTTPSAPESDTNIVDKSGEELDVISIDREVSSEPTTSSGGGSVIPAVLGVGAAGAAAVAGIKLMKNKKEKENTYEDESSENINSFSYLNNYPEDEQQDSVANLNEELE